MACLLHVLVLVINYMCFHVDSSENWVEEAIEGGKDDKAEREGEEVKGNVCFLMWEE